MKIIPLKQLLCNNTALKIISLILAYSFWHITSLHNTITVTTLIPLCFDENKYYDIIAPEKIHVTLKGKRSDLYTLDFSTLAAYINSATLSVGKNDIILQEKNLFLPHSVSIVHYKPANLIVTVTEKFS